MSDHLAHVHTIHRSYHRPGRGTQSYVEAAPTVIRTHSMKHCDRADLPSEGLNRKYAAKAHTVLTTFAISYCKFGIVEVNMKKNNCVLSTY